MVWFSPVAQRLLQTLATRPLQLVMDGSVVGRGCLALMVSCVYHGRALPLCWIAVAAPKGHFPQDTHRSLLAQVAALVPKGAEVTFLGDGEFDGTLLQADLERLGWHYVCRTGSNIVIEACGRSFQVGDVPTQRGESVALSPVLMTAKRYGPVSLVIVWKQQFTDPLYLITNIADLDRAVEQYKARAHIETFFSDQKSRGFQLHKSHISNPERLSRLVIASCLTYLWLIYLGVCALEEEWMRLVHRKDRCDVSLFRLGLRLLYRCLKERVAIPPGLCLPSTLPAMLVRTFDKHPT